MVVLETRSQQKKKKLKLQAEEISYRRNLDTESLPECMGEESVATAVSMVWKTIMMLIRQVTSELKPLDLIWFCSQAQGVIYLLLRN